MRSHQRKCKSLFMKKVTQSATNHKTHLIALLIGLTISSVMTLGRPLNLMVWLNLILQSNASLETLLARRQSHQVFVKTSQDLKVEFNLKHQITRPDKFLLKKEQKLPPLWMSMRVSIQKAQKQCPVMNLSRIWMLPLGYKKPQVQPQHLTDLSNLKQRKKK